MPMSAKHLRKKYVPFGDVTESAVSELPSRSLWGCQMQVRYGEETGAAGDQAQEGFEVTELGGEE